MLKKNLGYNETFINVDVITGMSYMLARSKYPLSCIILAEHGYIETDKQFKRRVEGEFKAEMKESQKEFKEEFQKEYERLIREMKY